MKELIKRIASLAESHPEKVVLYPPANDTDIAYVEGNFSFKFHEDLRELYRFSNGLSFLDYCLLGIGNKRIADFHQDNYHDELIFDSKKVFTLIGTSGYHEFGFLIGQSESIILVDSVNQDLSLISNSFESFFNKLISRVELILKSEHSKDELMMYIDDESLPELSW